MSLRLGRGLTAIPRNPRVSNVGDKMADETTNVNTGSENASTAKLSTKKGKTRGKNPRDIEYQAFDLEQPATLPKNLKEFMTVTGVTEQNDVLAYVIDGFNAAQYSAASDEIGEFINDAWDKETQAQFRLAVRNYSKLTSMSIDDSVALIKPGVEKAWEKKQAEKAAKSEESKPEPVGV